ncbi:MAG: hypothetical protein SF182_25855 [Deltaproteobacteria bacterium]|nr:hypothetical protein [Deltaproteobacteria bacterium]
MLVVVAVTVVVGVSAAVGVRVAVGVSVLAAVRVAVGVLTPVAVLVAVRVGVCELPPEELPPQPAATATNKTAPNRRQDEPVILFPPESALPPLSAEWICASQSTNGTPTAFPDNRDDTVRLVGDATAVRSKVRIQA